MAAIWRAHGPPSTPLRRAGAKRGTAIRTGSRFAPVNRRAKTVLALAKDPTLGPDGAKGTMNLPRRRKAQKGALERQLAQKEQIVVERAARKAGAGAPDAGREAAERRQGPGALARPADAEPRARRAVTPESPILKISAAGSKAPVSNAGPATSRPPVVPRKSARARLRRSAHESQPRLKRARRCPGSPGRSRGCRGCERGGSRRRPQARLGVYGPYGRGAGSDGGPEWPRRGAAVRGDRDGAQEA